MKKVAEDALKVIVDYRFASKKKKQYTDSGLFTMISHKKCIEKPMGSFGLSLVCEGKKIKNPEKF